MSDKKTWADKAECRRADRLISEHKHKAVIFYDLETTGVNPKKDLVIQFFGSRFELSDGRYRFVKKLELYIKPAIPVPKQASDVNHITNEFLQDKPLEAEAFKEINRFFGDLSEVIVCGYNIVKFDNILMDQMYMRNAGTHFSPESLDAMLMANELVSRKDITDESYKLVNVGTLYGIIKENMHNASSDVSVTAKLFYYLLEDFRDKYGDEELRMETRGQIYIKAIYPFNKGHKANYVMMKVLTYQDGRPVTGQIHYDVYNKRYVEDEGDFFNKCNLITFAQTANAAAGGDINKFKERKKEAV